MRHSGSAVWAPPGRDNGRGKPLVPKEEGEDGRLTMLDDSGHKGLADCPPPLLLSGEE